MFCRTLIDQASPAVRQESESWIPWCTGVVEEAEDPFARRAFQVRARSHCAIAPLGTAVGILGVEADEMNVGVVGRRNR